MSVTDRLVGKFQEIVNGAFGKFHYDPVDFGDELEVSHDSRMTAAPVRRYTEV